MNLGFKIHSFDNSNSVPWEYYPTLFKCEVGDLMVIADNGDGTTIAAPIELALMENEQHSRIFLLPIFICMKTNGKGMSLTDGSEEIPLPDEVIPVVAIRDDMVLECVFAENPTGLGLLKIAVKTINGAPKAMLTDASSYIYGADVLFRILSYEPLGIEIDGQPAYKVLVRYIG